MSTLNFLSYRNTLPYGIWRCRPRWAWQIHHLLLSWFWGHKLRWRFQKTAKDLNFKSVRKQFMLVHRKGTGGSFQEKGKDCHTRSMCWAKKIPGGWFPRNRTNSNPSARSYFGNFWNFQSLPTLNNQPERNEFKSNFKTLSIIFSAT